MKFPQIQIRIVPFKELRFTTAGDWKLTDNFLDIWIVDVDNWKYQAIVLMHEITEILVCFRYGITSQSADEFDALWEKELKQGLHKPEEEAGCDKRAPYRKGHMWGIRMEHLFCFILGVKWSEYDKFWENYFKDK